MTRPRFKYLKEKALNNPEVREEYEASTEAFTVTSQLIALRQQADLKTYQMAKLKSEAAPAKRGDFEAFLGAVPNVEVEVETDGIE